MALRVSTVSGDVFLPDLGIYVTHPTVSRDLTLEFSSLDLKKSSNLTTAIQNGQLTVDDGTYTIYATDYDPDEVLIQQLGYRDDTLYVSEAELISRGDVYLKSSTFPLSLNSTAQATKNVYCPSARWITWQLSADDKIVITGCAAAGTYTVKSVTDQQNFIVNEAIVNSSNGYISAFHPDASTRIGVDDVSFNSLRGSTLHSSLAHVDGHLKNLQHGIAEASYEEITYTGIHPTSLIVWTNSGKTTKIREEQYTWTGNHVNTLTMIQYNALGVESERVVETYTYTNSKVTSVSRSHT